MRAFITVGTLSFLKKYITKHPQITFYFMSNMYGSGTLVYYEHQRKKIFAAGKVFNILFAQGELQEKGYVSMETIPVSVDAQPDRKSTRLNSSHVAISYAVFCLKKKIM